MNHWDNNNSIVESRSTLNNITNHLIGQVGSSSALSSQKRQVMDTQNDNKNVSSDQIIIGCDKFEDIIKAFTKQCLLKTLWIVHIKVL